MHFGQLCYFWKKLTPELDWLSSHLPWLRTRWPPHSSRNASPIFRTCSWTSRVIERQLHKARWGRYLHLARKHKQIKYILDDLARYRSKAMLRVFRCVETMGDVSLWAVFSCDGCMAASREGASRGDNTSGSVYTTCFSWSTSITTAPSSKKRMSSHKRCTELWY